MTHIWLPSRPTPNKMNHGEFPPGQWVRVGSQVTVCRETDESSSGMGKLEVRDNNSGLLGSMPRSTMTTAQVESWVEGWYSGYDSGVRGTQDW